MRCRVFDVDISTLSTTELKERCSGCLEHSGGEFCNHIITDSEESKKQNDNKIMSTPIYIATRRRAGRVPLLKDLNEVGNDIAIIFVEPSEVNEYRMHYPNIKIVNIGMDGQGLAFVRNAILKYAIEQNVPYYWMLDDDIKGFYQREGTKMVKSYMMFCLEEAEKLFLREGAWHAGLEYQQFAWSATKDCVINSFCDNAVWFDVSKCKILEGKYRLWLKVDRDFCMQVIEAGGKTVRSTLHAFATPPDGSNTGGLKEIAYDIADLEEKNVDALIALWPAGVVTKFTKDSGRVDAKIHWNKIGTKQNSTDAFIEW